MRKLFLVASLFIGGLIAQNSTTFNTNPVVGSFTPYQLSPDVIVTTGGIFDYYTHQAASVSSVNFKILSLAGMPTFSSTSIITTLSRSSTGGLQSSGLTVKTGFTQVVYSKGIVNVWVNTEMGISKFDFASLGNFDGSVGLSFDLGKVVTKGRYHVYVTPFAREVAITSLQVKPVFGLQIGTGFTR